MSQRFVLTFHGRNRPGILAALTTALAELGADMTEASETVVGGYFSILISAEFPEHRTADVIEQHLTDVGRSYEMTVGLRSVDHEEPTCRELDSVRYFLTIGGRDTPGILRSIAATLANESVDILDFYGIRQPGDANKFTMLMELSIPSSVDVLELETMLEDFGALSGLVIDLEHEDFFSATAHPRSRIMAIHSSPENETGDSLDDD